MIRDHTRSDDEIIRVIETMYPDPLERKEFINIRRKSDDSTILLTLSTSRTYREKLIVYLLRNGANPNVTTTDSGISGIHPIDYHGKDDVSRTMHLLAYGADPNATKWFGYSTLHTMIYNGKVNISSSLMIHGAKLKPGDMNSLRRCGRSHIFFNFYDNITLRRISLHYIRLEQIRSQ